RREMNQTPIVTAIHELGLARTLLTNLTEAFADRDEGARLVAIRTISSLADQLAPVAEWTCENLFTLLNDGRADVRFEALLAIERLRPTSTQAVVRVAQLFREMEWESDGDDIAMRGEAARILGRMGTDGAPAIPCLIEVSGDAHSPGREDA